MPSGRAPWVPGGPLAPRNFLVVGAWWMLRETEASNLRAALVTFADGAVPTLTLTLPASKVDSGARGVSRTHACVCPRGPLPNCPVHAAADQMLVLRRTFAARLGAGGAADDLPFFPDAGGRPVTKSAATRTILRAAALLDVPARSADGAARVSGHSLRPTGAQGLTRLGLDTWAVKLLGRWGSSAVLTYVREAAASPEAAVARRRLLVQNGVDADVSACDWTLRQLRRQVAVLFDQVAAKRAPAVLEALRADLLETARAS